MKPAATAKTLRIRVDHGCVLFLRPRRYVSLLRSSVIPALGHVRLQDLTPQHLDDFYTRCLSHEPGRRAGSTISPTTVHHRHVALKMSFERAVELGMLAKNPAQLTSPPRPSRGEMRVLSEDEAKRLLVALTGTPAELPAYLALTTGARLGELLALRWSDIDLDTGVAQIRRAVIEHMVGQGKDSWYSFKEPKSGHGRSVDLGAATTARLRRHRRAQAAARLTAGASWTDLDLVIATPTGQPIRPSTTSRRFRTVVGYAPSCTFRRLPIAPAARSKVESVTDGFVGSSRRSTAERLVFMRRASSDCET